MTPAGTLLDKTLKTWDHASADRHRWERRLHRWQRLASNPSNTPLMRAQSRLAALELRKTLREVAHA